MGQMQAKYIIGIDGGGTGCRVAIANTNGQVEGQGESGPANATTDIDAVVRHVTAALGEAADMAGIPEPDLAASVAHAGIAGVLTDEQATTIANALPMFTTVTEDTVTALKGALGDRDGILMSLGTGTLVGRARKGRTEFLGGWGLIVSDQASAGWLGKALLTEALLCNDGLSPPTALSRDILSEFDNDPRAIVAFAASAAPADFANFAPRVTESASAGDPLALSLVQTAMTYLTDVIDTLGLGRKEVLCMTGGLGPFYEKWLMPNHKSYLAPAEGTALDGALALAREAAAAT